MSAHTPGPWRVVKGDNGDADGWNVHHELGWPHDVSQVAETSDYPYFAIKNEADAHLIAAAPDLLEALKKVIENHCGLERIFCSTCTPARRVIAKAEGRS